MLAIMLPLCDAQNAPHFLILNAWGGERSAARVRVHEYVCVCVHVCARVGLKDVKVS